MRSLHRIRSGVTPQSLLLLTGGALLCFAAETPMTTTGPASNEPAKYAVIDLGTDFYPVAINNSNVVLSSSAVWSGGSITNLPLGSNGPISATGINDAGQISGTAHFYYPQPVVFFDPEDYGWGTQLESHACSWANASAHPVDLDAQQNNTLTQHNAADIDAWNEFNGIGYSSEGTCINDVGVYGNAFGEGQNGYFFSSGVDPVPALPGLIGDAGIWSAAGTNYCGWVDSATNGALYNGRIISPDPGYIYYGLDVVNSSGAAVGGENDGTTGFPILYQGGTNLILPDAFWYAAAINNHTVTDTNNVTRPAPQIVGEDTNGLPVLCDQTYYNGAPSTNSAYGGYVVKYLNAMLAQPSTNAWWSVIEPTGINNGGAIVGWATYTQVPYAPVYHGVMLVPNYITRDGKDINSTNNTVCVGQQINLTNMISGVPTNAITSYRWGIPGTAFVDYVPDTNYPSEHSNYTNLEPSYLTNSYCNFYWFNGGTNRMVYCTNVIYGQTNVVFAQFQVETPTVTSSSANAVTNVSLDTNYSTPGGLFIPVNVLHLGDIASTPGVAFSASITPPTNFSTGHYEWVQKEMASLAQVTYGGTNYYSKAVTNALDTRYPMFQDTNAVDGPSISIASTNWNPTSYEQTFTMYLLWEPNTPNSRFVALKQLTWHWRGTAVYGSTNGWSLTSPQIPGIISFVDATNNPTWDTNTVSIPWVPDNPLVP